MAKQPGKNPVKTRKAPAARSSAPAKKKASSKKPAKALESSKPVLGDLATGVLRAKAPPVRQLPAADAGPKMRPISEILADQRRNADLYRQLVKPAAKGGKR